MSYEYKHTKGKPRTFDYEHLKAASAWTELGMHVFFYQYERGKFDIGDAIHRLSGLARNRNAQLDVLLEDHNTGMEVAFVQEHFLEVIREVYELNEQNEQTGVGSLVRFAVLTCNGPGAFEKLKYLANSFGDLIVMLKIFPMHLLLF